MAQTLLLVAAIASLALQCTAAATRLMHVDDRLDRRGGFAPIPPTSIAKLRSALSKGAAVLIPDDPGYSNATLARHDSERL